MVPNWLEHTLLVLLFAFCGALFGLFGPGIAWGIILGLIVLCIIYVFELAWRAAMRSLGARFFTKKV